MKAVKEELGDKASQVNIITINLDKTENHPLGAEYQVKYVPSIFFMDKDENIIESYTGAMVKEDVLKSIENLGVK